ncbi:MAG: hypothetical protein MHM6MM_000360 [Cercozoa sp. M6MM]
MSDATPSAKPFEQLSREELLELARSQEEKIARLRRLHERPVQPQPSAKRRKKKARKQIDFSTCRKRHIAVKFAYIGEKYYGLAMQDGFDTVEGRLVKACQQAQLIPTDGDMNAVNWSRSGRTDKGVSSLGNVFSAVVRCKASTGVGVVGAQSTQEESEMDYIRILNGMLPPDIRCFAWAPVPANFSARFSCISRCYKYYFFEDGMDIDAMRVAAGKLVGTHDFRNLCKADVRDVSHFVRTLHSFEVRKATGSRMSGVGRQDALWEVQISGSGFLYHQVRMMMAVLFHVGQGKESPAVVDQLLDVARYPCRPQYDMASDKPLLLFDTVYDSDLVRWRVDPDAQLNVFRLFHRQWREQTISLKLHDVVAQHALGNYLLAKEGNPGLQYDLTEVSTDVVDGNPDTFTGTQLRQWQRNQSKARHVSF